MPRAIRIHQNGGPEVMRFEDVEIGPPASGEVRLRHTAIGINFSDVNVRRGGFYFGRPQQFPLALGNEAAGVIEALGQGVVGFASASASLMRACAGNSSRTPAPTAKLATSRHSAC